MSVCLDMRLGECEWGSEQAVGDWICLSVCTRVCVRAWPRVSVFVRAGDAKPKQHGSAERWPSWVEPACRVMSPPDVRPNLWSSFLLTLTHSFPLSHLSVFHLSTSLLSALSPLPLSGPCSLLPPCMKSPFTPRVYTKILPLNATHILCPPPQKKNKKQMALLSRFPLFILLSELSSSLPLFPMFLSIQPV